MTGVVGEDASEAFNPCRSQEAEPTATCLAGSMLASEALKVRGKS
jgi:hypothetical protein